MLYHNSGNFVTAPRITCANIKKFWIVTHSLCTCFVWFSYETLTTTQHKINRLDFVIEKKNVFPVKCELRFKAYWNKSRKAPISVVNYVRPSPCLCVSAPLLLDEFSWNLLLVTLITICWETPHLLYRTNTTDTVSEDLGTFYYRQQKENSAKETYCYISMAKLTTFIRLTVHVDKQQ